jgi:hypothetical protein
MENIVEEFEKRTGKRLKDREKGVLGELVQKDLDALLSIKLKGLKLELHNDVVKDWDGVTMGHQPNIALKLGDDVISRVNVSSLK